jgi:queuine/archaeosine tRNA-ribosyltransferase
VIAAAGGLHKFTGRNRPFITDSGGFQVRPWGKLHMARLCGVLSDFLLDRCENVVSHLFLALPCVPFLCPSCLLFCPV